MKSAIAKHLAAGVAATSLIILAACSPNSSGGAASAQSTAAQTSQTETAQNTPIDAMAVAHNQVMIDGKPLHYTTRSGLIPLYDNDTRELMARMFIISYTADRVPGAPPRPVTFIWNGGPGSSSSQVHLVGFGPKGFKTPDTYLEWHGTPKEIADRPDSWFGVSDLVFVDPIGTGYSRATSDKYRDILYTQRGDGEAVAEMIRIYRTRYDLFDTPLFIAGESYGTTRAMEVAGDLARRRTPLAGVVLISGGYNAGQVVPRNLNDALQVSMYATTGYYHKRLAPELQALSQDEAVKRAVDWARNDYAPALEKRDTLTPAQRTDILNGLQRYTGIDPKFVNAKTLTIAKGDFTDRLLDDKDLELGRYDSRMGYKRRDMSTQWEVARDPSINPMIDLMQGTNVELIRYIRNDLQYKDDLLYRGPFGEAFHPLPMVATSQGLYDDSMSAMWNHGPSGAAARLQSERAENASQAATEQGQTAKPPLQQALEELPKLQVFNVKGMYDGSCAAVDEAVARSAPDIKPRVRNGCYGAGHMVYTDVATRGALLRDYAKFVNDAIAAQK